MCRLRGLNTFWIGMLLALNSIPFVCISRPFVGLASESFKERTRHLLFRAVSRGRVVDVSGRRRRRDAKKGVSYVFEFRQFIY